MLPRLLGGLGISVDDFLVSKSKSIVKNREMVADDKTMKMFQTVYIDKNRVSKIPVKTDDRTLTAFKMQLDDQKEGRPLSEQKAIVFILGNNGYVANDLPGVLPLSKKIIEESLSASIQLNVAWFCQDYRGRGFNQHNNDNFNDYSIEQDAKDQAAFIKTLVDAGYKPKNIMVFGYSYGSAVGLWAMYHLIKTYGDHFANIKFFSDRGYGNPFNGPIVSLLIADQQAAHQKLFLHEMMPDIPLGDIAEKLPNSCVFRVEDDLSVYKPISLADAASPEKLPGRIWVGRTDVEQPNPHSADHFSLQFKAISELKPALLITAMLNEIPIQLCFTKNPLLYDNKPFPGYIFKEGATPDSDDFIAMSKEISTQSRIKDKYSGPRQKLLSVRCQVIAELVNKLHLYCLARAERAKKSGIGAQYNKAWLGQTGLVGWTAKQQVQMAIRLMDCITQTAPDHKTIEQLANESGPHRSGELSDIFLKIKQFSQEYSQLKEFNLWIMTVKSSALKPTYDSQGLVTSRLFPSQDDIADDWEDARDILDSKPMFR